MKTVFMRFPYTSPTSKSSGISIRNIDKEKIEKAVTALRDVVAEEDPAAIQSSVDQLQEVSMKLGEAMYKEQAEAAGAAGSDENSSNAAKNSDETVVDADFEEVKDDDQTARQ